MEITTGNKNEKNPQHHPREKQLQPDPKPRMAANPCSLTDAPLEEATKHLQLSEKERPRLTSSHGAPVGDKSHSLTVGPRGPMLLQDLIYLDEITKFDRERIPERVVHAKGSAAFGEFVCTSNEIQRYTCLKPFEAQGKKTPLVVRFSTVAGERGTSDTVRDPRGFAIKFYTEEGNWDLVCNNTPIFFIRDSMHFPSLIHALKRDPQTNVKNPNMFWDFFSQRPESVHQLSFMFSDRGIPDGFRHMHGYGSHTFKLVNADKEAVYCKFHLMCDQGWKNTPIELAAKLDSEDPDSGGRDLFNAIEKRNFPSWTMQVQVMTFEQAEKAPFNPFDVTKVWPHKDYPKMDVGKLTLNRNPLNYFAEVEQLAFDPGHMIPGIEPSPDKMLQGRLISYRDTQFHRLGANYMLIPVNCPYNAKVLNYQGDGPMVTTDNFGNLPRYYPNSKNGPVPDPKYVEHRTQYSGDVYRYDDDDEDNYSQCRVFFTKVLSEDARDRLCRNIAMHLGQCSSLIQERSLKNLFEPVHEDYGRKIREYMQGGLKSTSVKTALVNAAASVKQAIM